MSRERSLSPSPPAAAALQCPPQTEIVDRARPFSCFVVIAHSPFPPFLCPISRAGRPKLGPGAVVIPPLSLASCLTPVFPLAHNKPLARSHRVSSGSTGINPSIHLPTHRMDPCRFPNASGNRVIRVEFVIVSETSRAAKLAPRNQKKGG